MVAGEGPVKMQFTKTIQILNFLLLTFRVNFKVPLLVYKAVHGLGPSYTANSRASYIPQRSSPDALLEVPNKSRNELGNATFATYAPKIIKIRLKTYLYTVAFTAT